MNNANFKGTALVVLDPDGVPYPSYEYTIYSNNEATDPITGITSVIEGVGPTARYVFEEVNIPAIDATLTPSTGLYAVSRPLGVFQGGVQAPNTTHPTRSHDFRDPRPDPAGDPTSELF